MALNVARSQYSKYLCLEATFIYLFIGRGDTVDTAAIVYYELQNLGESVSIGFEEQNVWLVWFYSISTIVGYLMPNPVFTYILDI